MKIGSSSFVSERTGRFTSFYRIITRIGEGGYGQVYKVQHKKTGMIRAMKSTRRSPVISKRKVDRKYQGMILFEFQLLKNIDHPNIIRIYEIFTDDKNFYLITE